MFTIDRVNRLRRNYGIEEISLWKFALDAHDALDELDCHAGIDTGGGLRLAPIGRHGVIARNYVGARLALHEQHLARKPADKKTGSNPEHDLMFWLGDDTCPCKSCHCT